MYAGARTSQRMTSLNTMLVIQWSTFQGSIMHLLDDADQAQDRATYNCPWVNVGLQRSNTHHVKTLSLHFIDSHSEGKSDWELETMKMVKYLRIDMDEFDTQNEDVVAIKETYFEHPPTQMSQYSS
jgi:hypothetical protein